MGKPEFIKDIKNHGIVFLCDEAMKKHTTFKIGGNADVFVLPASEEELVFSVKAAKKRAVPYFILGKGSNILASDNGVEGAVICLDKMRGIKIFGNTAEAAAGNSLQSLCIKLQKAGLSGLEFAYGIPGTVGGAVYMNAGAYGGEIKDRIISARYLDKSGDIKKIAAEDMCLAYRKSIFQANGGVILSASFELDYKKPSEILEKMEDFLSRRKQKQPLNMPSAGSVFRRPEGNFAGMLIEKSGLKGISAGGAAVSQKHAGFIVNTGNAKSSDVKKLIKIIKEKVFKDSNIMLQTEVVYMGRDE
ncbi:MAG: UDP-N-acetylmuramate dehydrogenase [Clostridia bacterium]|nr:UDP-N-acetylmuramate dehydrogenase [Clostridia bacterium]